MFSYASLAVVILCRAMRLLVSSPKVEEVSIHRANCANVQVPEAKERLIPVEWKGDLEHNYSVDIEITGMDRRGLLNEVLQAVSESKTDIVGVSGRTDRHKMAFISMTISIHNIDHLHKVVDRIKRVWTFFRYSELCSKK